MILKLIELFSYVTLHLIYGIGCKQPIYNINFSRNPLINTRLHISLDKKKLPSPPVGGCHRIGNINQVVRGICHNQKSHILQPPPLQNALPPLKHITHPPPSPRKGLQPEGIYSIPVPAIVPLNIQIYTIYTISFIDFHHYLCQQNTFVSHNVMNECLLSPQMNLHPYLSLLVSCGGGRGRPTMGNGSPRGVGSKRRAGTGGEASGGVVLR